MQQTWKNALQASRREEEVELDGVRVPLISPRGQELERNELNETGTLYEPGQSSSESYVRLEDVNLSNNCDSPRTEKGEGEDDSHHYPGRLSAAIDSHSAYGRLRKFLCSSKLLVFALFMFIVVQIGLKLLSTSHETPASSSHEPVCTSKLWSNGHWKPRPVGEMGLIPPINSIEQAMKVSKFPSNKCASNRLPLTNTAIPRMENDTAEYWNWRYKVSSYEWFSGCEKAGLDKKPSPTPESLLHRLINDGGWMFVGDSLSAQWFMSLSCFLEPYVRTVPFWTTEVPWNATQHMYLKPNTSFSRELKLPADFDPDTTPLVSVLRSGLLLSKTEITKIIAEHNLVFDTEPLYGDEQVFDMHTTQYLADFLNPKLRYSRLIASAGAHYTQKFLNGRPLHQVADIFHYDFEHWAQMMAGVLKDPKSKGKKIYYRTATAGHDNCHEARKTGPWNEEHPLERPVWNWQTIPLFNKIADAVLSSMTGPRPDLLSIERPAMLRADAHILIDCLHFTVGAGVIEGWTDFIYNYT